MAVAEAFTAVAVTAAEAMAGPVDTAVIAVETMADTAAATVDDLMADTWVTATEALAVREDGRAPGAVGQDGAPVFRAALRTETGTRSAGHVGRPAAAAEPSTAATGAAVDGATAGGIEVMAGVIVGIGGVAAGAAGGDGVTAGDIPGLGLRSGIGLLIGTIRGGTGRGRIFTRIELRFTPGAKARVRSASSRHG